MKLFDKLDRYLVNNNYRVVIEESRIHIINYIEIEDFSSKMVVIRYKDGKCVLEGEMLVVSKMIDDELLITGKLKSIVYK